MLGLTISGDLLSSEPKKFCSEHCCPVDGLTLTVERAPWQKIHELREYRLAGIHDQALPRRMVEESRIRDQIHPSNDRAKSVTYQWSMVSLTHDMTGLGSTRSVR
jgi:hypothetical protein